MTDTPYVPKVDPKWLAYERDRCENCGNWIPWPAMDDHDCTEEGDSR